MLITQLIKLSPSTTRDTLLEKIIIGLLRIYRFNFQLSSHASRCLEKLDVSWVADTHRQS